MASVACVSWGDSAQRKRITPAENCAFLYLMFTFEVWIHTTCIEDENKRQRRNSCMDTKRHQCHGRCMDEMLTILRCGLHEHLVHLWYYCTYLFVIHRVAQSLVVQPCNSSMTSVLARCSDIGPLPSCWGTYPCTQNRTWP